VLAALKKVAEEAQLQEKYQTLYNGAVINTERIAWFFII
jgi:hypothetical protein